MGDAEAQQIDFMRKPEAVEDTRFGLAKRRGHFVLDHLDSRVGSDGNVTILDNLRLAYVETDGCIKLQGSAAGSRLWTTEHHADLLTNLVDEYDDGLRLTCHPGEFAQCLRH